MLSWVVGQSCKSCGQSDPTTDTVRFDPSGVVADVGALEKEQEQRQREGEEDAQRERKLIAELERQRVEEEERLRCRNEEIAAQIRREKQEAEERARLERQREQEQEAAQAEEARKRILEAETWAREEASRVERERLRAEEATAKKQLEAWLSKNGYADVNAKKTKMFKTTYPLHDAVKQGDASTVRQLLRFKADPKQKCSGQTPQELAQKTGKKGSSEELLTILTSQSRRHAGA